MTNLDPKNAGVLQGLRILIVEDEAMIASYLEDALTDLGCEVIGPALNLKDALRLAREEAIDGAGLDVNIAGEKVYAVADILAERGLPFVFMTGYGKAGLRESDRDRPVLQKPYNLERLVEIMTQWR
ncbi:response regulator [Polyangium jinanense]|uniref:Response regulator n=1 Tax=Polyangium jinanense TaxID=2829994 RepID=A0A9X3X1Y8_9BACT|nr:response regulator [Polyangium jinanense]MDC3955521.1 response regulator [Polyangium jinanense]MDC3982157.1 response regulator [Polyangium jinanense]